jgi:hypothetical protein
MSKPFKLTAPRPLESLEQSALFAYAEIQARNDPRWGLLFAIPNGTSASSMAEAMKVKREGRKSGVPDVFFPVASRGWNGLFVELKQQGGKESDLSPQQKAWLAALNAEGYRAVVAFGWEDAVKQIKNYLGSGE